MRIVDTFTFNNEFDILDIRLEELDEVVDFFVLVESDRTFQGQRKPLHFQENRHRFGRFQDRIIHVIVDDMPTYNGDPWVLEFHQRRAISRGLNRLAPSDFVLVSDVDEIPRADAVNSIRSISDIRKSIVVFKQQMIRHKLNWTTDEDWYGTRGMQLRHLIDPQITRKILAPLGRSRTQVLRRTLRWHWRIVRYMKRLLKPVPIADGGWHFSYIGDADFTRQKIRSFSHNELDTPETIGDGVLEAKLSAHLDLFGKHVRVLPMGDMPRFVQLNTHRYRHLLDDSAA